MRLWFLEFLWSRRPASPATVKHLETVDHEMSRVARSAAEVHDVIRDFVHGMNAEKQRENARRGE